MVLEKLGDAMTGVVRKITAATLVDKKLIKEIVKDIQRALLSADVNVKLVMDLSKRIEERSLTEKPKAGSRKEHTVKIVYEELVNLLGASEEFKAEKGRIPAKRAGIARKNNCRARRQRSTERVPES